MRQGRMRCPAIEGIETNSGFRRRLRGREVECVAPLLRGLKRERQRALGVLEFRRRMRCPAIEGIETPGGTAPASAESNRRRMRCPAIEGIETRDQRQPRGTRPELVECVAPLLRGLKPPRWQPTPVPHRSAVECVAPLLRGLKRYACRNGETPLRGALVECVAPLLRGLKPNPISGRPPGPCRCRMRCPAIEGIETGKPVLRTPCRTST